MTGPDSPKDGLDGLMSLSQLTIPTPVRLSRPSVKIRVRDPSFSNAIQPFQTSIFGYDIRLVHSLIGCINDYVQSKQKIVSIDWHIISATLDTPRRLSPSECQNLWRYCAYHMDEYGRNSDKTVLDVSSLADDDSDIDMPTAKPQIRTDRCADDETQMPKRKWTNASDIRLLQAILEHGESNWEVIGANVALNRDLNELEQRWKVMQKSVEAGRYKNEKIIGLVKAINELKTATLQPSADVQTAADAMASLMDLI